MYRVHSYALYYTIHRPCLRNRRIKAKSPLRIILLLQHLQLLLTPLLRAIPLLRRLVSKRIIHVRMQLLPPTSLAQNLPQPHTQAARFLINLRVGRIITDQRRSKDVIATVRERGGLHVNRLDTLLGVSFEHEDGVEERGGRSSFGREEVVCFLLCGHVVFLDIRWEARVCETGFLARWRVVGDARPGGGVEVGSGLRLDGERADGVEGCGDGGIDGGDAFLDDVEDDNGLN